MIKELECIFRSGQEKLTSIPADAIGQHDSGVDTDYPLYSVPYKTEKENGDLDTKNTSNDHTFLEKLDDQKMQGRYSDSIQTLKHSSKRRLSWKSDDISNDFKLTLLRDSIKKDLENACNITANMKSHIGKHVSDKWLKETLRKQDEVTRCIAESYNICNDPDTFSYVNGHISLHSIGSPVASLRSEKLTCCSISQDSLSASVNICALGNDKLYPLNPITMHYNNALCSVIGSTVRSDKTVGQADRVVCSHNFV